MQKQANPSLREIQRQEREELILQTAEEVFLEKGYYETSIDEIAARVGVAKGTVYLHFASKEELVVAIMKRNVQRFVNEIDALLAPRATPREKLEELLCSMYTGLFRREARFFNAVFNGVDMQRILSVKKSALRPVMETMIAKVTALLEAGKAAGELNSTIPTSVMLSSFFQLLSPRSYECLFADDTLAPEERVQHIARIYFSGITTSKDEK